MSRTCSRITKSIATMLAAAAVVAPGAGASQDLRSADARDAAANTQTGSYTPPPSVDLRSPDAVDSAINQQSGSYAPSPGVDLRSPDAVDAARNPELVSYSAGSTSSDDSGGTDWGPVEIFSASVPALILVGVGVLAVRRRRSTTREPRIPAISS